MSNVIPVLLPETRIVVSKTRAEVLPATVVVVASESDHQVVTTLPNFLNKKLLFLKDALQRQPNLNLVPRGPVMTDAFSSALGKP